MLYLLFGEKCYILCIYKIVNLLMVKIIYVYLNGGLVNIELKLGD